MKKKEYTITAVALMKRQKASKNKQHTSEEKNNEKNSN